MRIVADENIPGLDATFGQFGDIYRCNGRKISAAEVKRADVLLVRSVCQVNRQLITGSSVRFVGSTTIGTDHMDTNFLQDSGIHWCHAPGCNADGAAQYSLAMILLAAQRAGLDITRVSAGVVGLGNVGKRLHRLLKLIGVDELVACDPPLAQAGRKELVNLKEIADCDLVSFHVPLTHSGPYATQNLGNKKFFCALKPGTLVINSSRGGVLEASAMNEWLDLERGHIALDVWPDEPTIEARLLDHVTVATPHVAGYSLEGKLNGTRMIFSQFLDWLEVESPGIIPPIAPPPAPLLLEDTSTLAAIILASCPVKTDDTALRACLAGKDRISGLDFDALRKNYPVRRDFSGTQLPNGISQTLSEKLKAMGFS
jgi:erythronate-4-phosphate dehydrogenase